MNTLKRQLSYAKGKHAEHQAMEYLCLHGYEILHQRFKTIQGEIDLIAHIDLLIVFVEVKARATYEDALTSITPRQTKRIIATAQHFITTLPSAEYDIRFDVITVSASGDLHHLENAMGIDYMNGGH